MGVSLGLLTFHVLLVLFADVITSQHGRTYARRFVHRLQRPLLFSSEKRHHSSHQTQPPYNTLDKNIDDASQTFQEEDTKLGKPKTEGEDAFDWEEPRLEGPVYSCGEGWCTCSASYADCSGHEGNLTYIPRLPQGISFLNFSHNKLRAIEDSHFFANVSNKITGLSLSDNELSYINPQAVYPGMANLSQVYLGFNYVGYDTLYYIVMASQTTLERLDVRGGNLGPLPPETFSTLSFPRLTALNVYGNHLLTLNLTMFKPLKGLQYLAVEMNEITEFIPDDLPSLRVLILRNNRIQFNFTQTCRHGNSLFPNLQRLDVFGNPITSVPSNQTCLPNLANLDLSWALFSGIPADTFGQRHFPHLARLILDNTILLLEDKVEKNAFRNPVLQVLSFRLTLMDFARVDPGVFGGLPNLTQLNLSYNEFSAVSSARLRQMLGLLSSLENLSLFKSGLPRIENDTFSSLQRLTALDLAMNSISGSLPGGAFDELKSLQSLNLSANQISMVRESAFSPATRHRLRHVDLSGNPFKCNVDLEWFCRWMRDSPAVFSNSSSSYQCADRAAEVTSIC